MVAFPSKAVVVDAHYRMNERADNRCA